jgi:hypothetical protein
LPPSQPAAASRNLTTATATSGVHPALQVLKDARSAASTDELLTNLYGEAVRAAAGMDYLPLKDLLDRPACGGGVPGPAVSAP